MTRERARRRIVWLISIALCLFAGSSLIAFTQAPHPDAWRPIPPFPRNLFDTSWWLYPQESNAFKRLPIIGAALNDVFVSSDGQNIWAVGNEFLIVHSADGGRTWFRQLLPKDWMQQDKTLEGTIINLNIFLLFTKEINEIDCWNDQFCWTVGTGGAILATRDGGATWEPQAIGTQADLSSVAFVSAREGWVVGSGGTILATRDGGATWEPQAIGTQADLSSVAFVSAREGWVVGSGGTILATRDGGATWEPQASGTQADLSSVAFVSVREGWAVGTGGTILATRDGGATWEVQASGTRADLMSAAFISVRQGWAVGDDGTILATRDGGATWEVQASGTTAWLWSVTFVSPRQGWAVGTGGTILATRDGGATWLPIQYDRWPAPWFWIVGCAIPVWLLVWAHRLQNVARPEEASVSSALVSDRPLDGSEPDPLHFSVIARGLSRFLRHEQTQPPLTIAVTGEWGTGKSSLMNLLKADLSRYGFQPVWFNAWHHQKEEHLLAALLDAVRSSSVPPWWHPTNWRFRARLLSLRIRRHLFGLLAVGIVYALIVGYLWNNPELLRAFFQAFLGTSDQMTEALSLVAQALPALGLLGRGLVAYGTKPASLLASLSAKHRLRDLAAQTGFRQAFAQEFADVCAALGPRRFPLIMIDDLDRCRPDKVLEVLEAVNFLVSSGTCVVVMGMALDRVERCVAFGFRDLAEAFEDEKSDEKRASRSSNAEPDPGISHARFTSKSHHDPRIRFARKYLQKLINLEVPVPEVTLQQSKALLETCLQRRNPIEQAFSLIRRMRTSFKQWLPVCVFAMALVGAFLVGRLYLPALFDSSIVEHDGRAAAPEAKAPAPVAKKYGEAPSIVKPHQEESLLKGHMTFVPGEHARLPLWPLAIMAVVLCGAGVWLLLRQPDAVEQDSPEFIEALNFWMPLVYRRHPTPRAFKRFLNRLRYLAMFQKQEKAARPFAWTGFNGRSVSSEHPWSTEVIPEKILVTLAVLYDYQPAILDESHGEQAYKELLSKELRSNLIDHSADEAEDHKAQPVECSYDGSDERIPRWSDLLPYRETFLQRLAGIHVN